MPQDGPNFRISDSWHAVSRPIAYDITRLFLGPLSRTPRGIDRIDIILAEHFFAVGNEGNVGVLPTPWGTRIYSAPRVRRGLANLRRLWAEDINPSNDPIWSALRQRMLSGAGETYRKPKVISLVTGVGRLGSSLSATGISLGRSAIRHVPGGAVYLNIGHLSLAVPHFQRWLDRRSDITSVFMLHDVIPLENPEFVSPSSARHHDAMVASTVRHADAVIVTTRHAHSTVTGALAQRGRPNIPTFARGLPLPAAFEQRGQAHADLAHLPYFVVCGSIEPRKNHSLLHEVWKNLSSQLGEATPHLVVVGSPGWNSEKLLSQLENCAATRRRIHPVSGLSTPALKQLLVGARGLLMPSWNEGFGLPVLEANALGIPVIASDIPSHREVASEPTFLLNPSDVDAWEGILLDWHHRGVPVTPARPANDDADLYCRDIANFLDQCASQKPQ